MALLLDYFIVDGFKYEFLPLNMVPVTTPEFGVRTSRYLTLDLGAQIITGVKATTSAEDFTHIRKIHNQGWAIEFDFIDQCMYDHFKILYDTQKHFYVQFDDEMSRDLAPLIRAGETGRSFFTPTYPIKPYGYYPGSSVDYLNDIKLYDGTTIVTLNDKYTIDEDLGLITFDNPISENVIVAMNYTWRANVRISGFELQPKSNLPQGYYTGTMFIEQVTTFDSSDPYVTLAPCYMKSNSNSLNPTVVSDIPSGFQDFSLPNSSGFITPTPSGSSVGSVVPTDVYSTVIPE